VTVGTADRSEARVGDRRPVSRTHVTGLRKTVVYRESTLTEGGLAPARPVERASVAAVVANPWVGTGPRKDLGPGIEALAPGLAGLMVDKLVAALGGVSRIEAFGKGALVGTRGELEHGAALIHTAYFGNLVRGLLEGESIICFADTRGSAGDSLVVPMWHKDRAGTRTHYQTVEARVPDAPRPDEIVVVVAGSTGPRPHPRIGDRTTDPAVTTDILEELLP
jgi:Amino acid synthesis